MSSAPKINNDPAWRIPTWFPDIPADQQAVLKTFMSELLKANKTTNLLPPKTVPVADQVHFADSILGARQIMKSGYPVKKIWDLGSGSGFPGIVFAVLFPSVEVHLIDSDQRKAEFLKQVVATLKLSNVVVHNQAIEKLGPNSVEFAVCRGFHELTKTMMMMRSIVQPGGVIFHMKSDVWGLELSRVPAQLCSIWDTGLVGNYELPETGISFAIVKTLRIAGS